MTRLVIVIPCSGEKLDYDPVARAIAGESPYVPAGELYVGAFHRYARQQAERLADEVLIHVAPVRRDDRRSELDRGPAEPDRASGGEPRPLRPWGGRGVVVSGVREFKRYHWRAPGTPIARRQR